MRISLPENIRWLSKELPENTQVVSTMGAGTDSIWVRKGIFKPTHTEFVSSFEYQTAAHTNEVVNIHVNHSTDFDYDAELMAAALHAVDDVVPEKLKIAFNKDIRNGTPALTITLSNDPLPASKGRNIIFKPMLSDDLLKQVTSDQWILTQRLNRDNAINLHLALDLAEILFPHKDVWTKANQYDIRMADDDLLTDDTDKSNPIVPNRTSIDSVWIILTALTLIAERWVAYKRNQ
jgi:hypothetical protein